MNEEILEKYRQYLRREYRKRRTAYNYYIFTKLFLQWTNKPVEKITKEDMLKWKEDIIHNYRPNGNIRRISSVNRFFKWLGKKDFILQVPKQEESNKIVLGEKELQNYIEASKSDPLMHLIALLQIDGLLRPSEFSNLKLSNIDLENQNFYLDDTKTGNNYIIISPRLLEALKYYLPYRNPLPEFEDYLIIIPNGRYSGRPPTQFGGFINYQTKKLAVKAGIKKYISPYIIKPSVMTLDFNNNVNPKIIQRKARHKKIESTLRYNHTNDEMVRKHFEKQQININGLDNKDRARILFNRYLSGEIDIETFKQSLDLLTEKETKHKRYQGIGYV
ncbi:MAG: tyrosine-type recombinase/integrase [Thermoplasmatales archaeon]|nr:MAG: tyrosine-type recombinase/integrase [Thermoplasmatales archaeon]